jgi:hypothetical protein
VRAGVRWTRRTTAVHESRASPLANAAVEEHVQRGLGFSGAGAARETVGRGVGPRCIESARPMAGVTASALLTSLRCRQQGRGMGLVCTDWLDLGRSFLSKGLGACTA